MSTVVLFVGMILDPAITNQPHPDPPKTTLLIVVFAKAEELKKARTATTRAKIHNLIRLFTGTSRAHANLAGSN
jgi:hypothetical protein